MSDMPKIEAIIHYEKDKRNKTNAIKICSCCEEVCVEIESIYVEVKDKDNKFTILLCQECLENIKSTLKRENEMYRDK